MKKLVKILAIVLAALGVFGILAACGGDNHSGGKQIKSVAMQTLPTKTEYYVGDTFDISGASIKVVYDDNTEEVLTLPADGFDVSSPDMSKAGERTVTVTNSAQRKRTQFKISVANQGYKLSFDLNYDGAPAATVVNVVKGSSAKKPTDPARDGHTFYKWYTDESCTLAYDFDTVLTADKTIYACWKDNAATYREVTYKLNYYGVKQAEFPQIVKDGEKAVAIASPVRTDFRFDGWFTDENCTAEFDVATSTITADTPLYAGWTKTKTGSTQYVFEAENTDLTGKVGNGFSGSASEAGLIVNNSNISASGNKYVSYLYKNGLTLDFYIASSEAVTDATVTVRVAAEMDNINFSSTQYQVIVNDAPLSYSDVRLVKDAAFADTIVISGVSLKEGANTIVLKTNNTVRPMGDASTYAATAPMVDCIKIDTTAVLIWDAVKGLPKAY